MKRQKRRPETAAVRGADDLEKKNGPVGTPIYQTSTFEVTDNEEQQRVTSTDRYYTRWGNPTNTVAEEAVAAIEGTEAALTFASGMGAITTTILALLKAGDHIVAQRDVYGGVTKFFTQWLPRVGIETTLVDTNDLEQHERAIRPNTRMLYLESPTNPSLRVVDMKKMAAIARQHKLISMIDSTFGTPINQRPAEYGIDRGDALGHEIFERARGLDLRCGGGTTGIDGTDLGDADDAGELHGSACGVDADPRAEDAGGAGGAAERERAARRGVFGATRKSPACSLPVSEEPSAACHCARANEWGRRHGDL